MAHESTFIMAALKSLAGNSNVRRPVLASIQCHFFMQLGTSLVLGMMSDYSTETWVLIMLQDSRR